MCISDSLPDNFDCDHSTSDITYNSLPLLSDPSDCECKYYDLHVFNSFLTSKTITPACIVHVNIKSLKKNLDKLVNFISDMTKSPAIIAVSETKINKKQTHFFQTKTCGCNFVYADSDQKAGGFRVYIKNNLSLQRRSDICDGLKDAESLWVETNIGGRQCVLGVIYRHPKYDCKGFTDYVSATLHYLSDKRLPHIICGDININLLQHTSSSSVHKYIEAYESYNCQQIITRPTATSASLVDHFYTTFDLEKVIPGILINFLSDNLPIFMLIKTNAAKIHDKKPIIKSDYTNFGSEMFREIISHKFQHLPQTEGNPSKDLNQALKVLGDSLNQHAPLKNLSRSKKKLSKTMDNNWSLQINQE